MVSCTMVCGISVFLADPIDCPLVEVCTPFSSLRVGNNSTLVTTILDYIVILSLHPL